MAGGRRVICTAHHGPATEELILAKEISEGQSQTSYMRLMNKKEGKKWWGTLRV